jgi:hypothetical protein
MFSECRFSSKFNCLRTIELNVHVRTLPANAAARADASAAQSRRSPPCERTAQADSSERHPPPDFTWGRKRAAPPMRSRGRSPPARCAAPPKQSEHLAPPPSPAPAANPRSNPWDGMAERQFWQSGGIYFFLLKSESFLEQE